MKDFGTAKIKDVIKYLKKQGYPSMAKALTNKKQNETNTITNNKKRKPM